MKKAIEIRACCDTITVQELSVSIAWYRVNVMLSIFECCNYYYIMNIISCMCEYYCFNNQFGVYVQQLLVLLQ